MTALSSGGLRKKHHVIRILSEYLGQYIPANIVDDYVVNAFFEALSQVELDAYSQAIKSQSKLDQSVERAHQQQLERLRYQAALAERQFNQVDPDNRLVAGALENFLNTSTLNDNQQNQTLSNGFRRNCRSKGLDHRKNPPCGAYHCLIYRGEAWIRTRLEAARRFPAYKKELGFPSSPDSRVRLDLLIMAPWEILLNRSIFRYRVR